MTPERPPALPLAYYEGLLDLLAADPRIRTITYADLPWALLDRPQDHYPREWRRWQRHADPDTIYVVLQHDVDASPERTLRVVELEAERGLRSSVMVFNRHHDRQRLARDGVLEFRPYDLDVPRLQQLEQSGFVVGYHSCAVEQSGWDLERAKEQFVTDVRELRESFDIRFFNPHGGVPGPGGVNNRSIVVPRGTRVRWVSNRHGCRWDAGYSDGALYGDTPLAERDLRDFVRTWQPGRRYRVLTHPQYYGATEPVEEFADDPWYRELFGRSPADIWRDVVVEKAS